MAEARKKQSITCCVSRAWGKFKLASTKYANIKNDKHRETKISSIDFWFEKKRIIDIAANKKISK